jgi:hypothetical protein
MIEKLSKAEGQSNAETEREHGDNARSAKGRLKAEAHIYLAAIENRGTMQRDGRRIKPARTLSTATCSG